MNHTMQGHVKVGSQNHMIESGRPVLHLSRFAANVNAIVHDLVRFSLGTFSTLLVRSCTFQSVEDEAALNTITCAH